MYVLAHAAFAAAVALSLPSTDSSQAQSEEAQLDSEHGGSFSPAAVLGAIELDGSWEVAGHALGDIPIDAEGNLLGQRYYVDHRLRLRPEIHANPHTTIFAELDLLRGPVAGDLTPEFSYLEYGRDARMGYRPASIDFRELYLEWQSNVGVLRMGQMASDWGLGILANNARRESVWGGPRFHGDLTERVLFATRPLAKMSEAGRPLVVAVAADLVYRDQSAQLLEGDRAFQGIFAVTWAPEDSESRAGLYAVRRSQIDRDGFALNVWVFDLHGRLVRDLSESAQLRVEGELAHVTGTTDMVRDVYALDRRVSQFGGAAEVALEVGQLETLLQTGYASGDTDPYDDRITSFEFDPEYRAGFILFQEVLAWQSAASATLAADPLVTGRPAAGARLLPTEGAVANALFIAPNVRLNVTRDFSVSGGVLWARTAADFIDPYTTNVVGGGYPRTFRGARPVSHDLGLEADVGVAYHLRDYDRRRASFYLQAGRFFPGAAFDAPAEGSTEPTIAMDPVDRVLGGVNLYW